MTAKFDIGEPVAVLVILNGDKYIVNKGRVIDIKEVDGVTKYKLNVNGQYYSEDKLVRILF